MITWGGHHQVDLITIIIRIIMEDNIRRQDENIKTEKENLGGNMKKQGDQGGKPGG